ncbi:MAG: NADH-quinone oxidoreductase subunit NuoE [Candidatus Eisenbacteria bacterium]|nr:NADH-quinone oxidoreductase subunit NuoE [Candidatus Eisenbacteria bacterium]
MRSEASRDSGLTAQEREAIARVRAESHDARAACIDALRAVQDRRGHVDDRALQAVADELGLSAHELEGVATFYNLIFRKPVGRHVILICDSISCWITGYESVRSALEKRLGIALGETTADGRFTLLTVPCLGACDRAPVMMIDDDLHGALSEEALGEILARYP